MAPRSSGKLNDVDLEAIRDYGVRVVETRGWRSRGRPYSFAPVGILNHHTVSQPSSRTPVPSLNVVTSGRSDLPGPLSQLLEGRDAVMYVIAAGNANHAGMGDRRVLDRVLADLAPRGDARTWATRDDLLGNPFLIGIEVENNGTGEPYSDAMIDALAATNAALADARGWTPARSIHHREWTPRKIDMSYRGPLRDKIADAMRAGGAILLEADAMYLCKRGQTGANVAAAQRRLNRARPAGTAALKVDGDYGRATAAMVAKVCRVKDGDEIDVRRWDRIEAAVVDRRLAAALTKLQTPAPAEIPPHRHGLAASRTGLPVAP